MVPTASSEVLPARPAGDETIRASSRWSIGLACAALILAGWAAYSNSFGDAFVFDDFTSILGNPTIKHGWIEALSPPMGTTTVSGRPILNLSLALNYELGGFNVWGYHAVNLAIQVLAGLTLFGLARRTLQSPTLHGRYGAAAAPLAFMIALLWTVHPLQTESVTYVAQRAESLMGLFYLLTIYCFIRGAESSRSWPWYALSAIACLFGMITKETMATAPLMVWLYDRTFIAGTFLAAGRKRWKVYAALAATWLPLAWLVVRVSWPGNASLPNIGMDGLNPVMKSFVYALKQCDAIVQYLALSFWPHRLNLNYGNDVVANPLDVAPQIVVVVLLLGGSLYAVGRKAALGFVAAWFFVILAPTSSVVPLNGQTMAEHHMYLSLAAVLALAVLGLHTLLGPRVYAAGLVMALALGSLTFERNRDYHTNISIWADALQSRPLDPAIQTNLGLAFDKADRPTDALPRYEMALRLASTILDTETNLGNILAHRGQFKEAIVHYQNEIQRNPNSAIAYYNLGNVYYVTNQPALARDAYVKAVSLNPGFALAHTNLASIYTDSFGEIDQAITEYEAAVRADPNLPEARVGLGNLYLKKNRAAEAIPHFTKAISLNPKYGDAYLGLGNALFMTSQAGEAVAQYQTALQFMPDSPGTHNNLGLAYLQLHRYDDAIHEFEETLRLKPDYPQGLENLQKARQLAPPPQKDTAPPAGK